MSSDDVIAETADGQTGWLSPLGPQSVAEYLRHALGLIDGVESHTYSVWRATNPGSIVVTPHDMGETFLQAAGSARAMTVEVRQADSGGTYRLYVVGRREPVGANEVSIPISASRAVRVRSNEVFTAEEAAVVFVDYVERGADVVSDGYELRELDLSVPQSIER